jgi:hypothetical protein
MSSVQRPDSSDNQVSQYCILRVGYSSDYMQYRFHLVLLPIFLTCMKYFFEKYKIAQFLEHTGSLLADFKGILRLLSIVQKFIKFRKLLKNKPQSKW